MRERSKGVFIILIAGVLVTGGLGTIHKLRPEQIIKKNLIQQQSAQQRVQEKSIEETFDEKTLKEDSKEPVHEQQSLGQPTQEQPVQEQPTQQQPIKEQVINKQTVQDENEKPKVTKQIPGVVWSIPTKSRVVFITIDDGWHPSEAVLEIMREQNIPLTAFVTQKAAQEHLDFWKEFVAAGGDIQNHTSSHPVLPKRSDKTIEYEIVSAQDYLKSLFPAPTLFRPPYGEYNQTVRQKAYEAGIQHVIMWNAVMSDYGLKTYNGNTLEPGSIILLHWLPTLPAQLNELFTILNEQNLGVASLPYALAHPDEFPVVWPTTRNP